MEPAAKAVENKKLPPLFWLYLFAAGLVAAGFVDYPLLAYHLETKTKLSRDVIPVFYAIAMGVSGVGVLLRMGWTARWE